MNKVLAYFKENQEMRDKIVNKDIRVYGWEFEYDYHMLGSISKYLFEDFEVIENIAPKTNDNRDGRVKPKYYITVHDTGDTRDYHNAKFWSEVVRTQEWEVGHYSASFQYVTGNDGIYHNIPDNEVAYHAGDSTYFDYTLYDTGLTGENTKPIVTISSDGYYEVDGQKTKILAPIVFKKKDDKVILDRIAQTSDINSQGVLCKLVDGKYYIGETYYSSGYGLISNRGGNNNSIGIESCINLGSDIYLTWQKTAKLVAHLLKDNFLDFDDIKQHHYFSGKNCPQTMRMNGLWEEFLSLVKFERQILDFLDEGYKISLKCDSSDVKENGRLISLPKDKVKYTIVTEFNGQKEELELEL